MKKIHSIIIAESFDENGLGLPKAALKFTENLPDEVEVDASISFQKLGVSSPRLNQRFVNGNFISKKFLWPIGLMKIISNLKPDIVHFHGIWTSAICSIPYIKNLGCKVIISPHGQFDNEVMRNNWLRKRLLFYTLFGASMSEANMFHVLNQYEMNRVIEFMGPRIHTKIIPNGIDAPSFQNDESKDLSIKKILYCGQFHHRKNILRLLQAWQRCCGDINCELHIAGDGIGSYSDRVKSEIKKIPKVYYHGYVTGLQKDKLYRSCHFGILVSRGEGQSLAVLESLAYGNPCIISEECRMPIVANTGIGWVVSTDLQLDKAIRTASIMKPSEYLEMSRTAMKFIHDHHRWPIVGNTMSRTYHNIVDGVFE